ncbi:MAG: YkgJ family cysteine cluster protein [Planctomycetes bacterium]|nr:YkgJ family cysteine cluster protein [Planctomycetota bacterium]
MSNSGAIFLLNDSAAAGAQKDGDLTVSGLDLDVLGQSLHLHIAASGSEARLADIVPIAREICDRVIDMVIEQLSKNGPEITCKKGCCACCRQLILLSVPEAFRLVQEIVSLPMDVREMVIAACRDAAGQVGGKLQEDLAAEGPLNPNAAEAYRQQVSDWFGSDRYQSLEINCPFLSGGLCAIYEQRPLLCRQWLVTGPAAQCEKGGIKTDHAVQMPVNFANVLAELTTKLEGSSREVVPLTGMFDWFSQNEKRYDKTWPAKQLIEQFIIAAKKDNAGFMGQEQTQGRR